MSDRLARVGRDATEDAFLAVPTQLHGADPRFRPEPTDAVRHVFDPTSNGAFVDGAGARWVLYGEDGAPRGRVAAFSRTGQEVGGVGFFACEDDLDAARRLFDAAATWLEERGCAGLDAPINFGERDRFWGLLVQGFDPPMPLEPWHAPYYQRLFDELGLTPIYETLSYRLQLETMYTERLRQTLSRVGADNFRYEVIDPRDVERLARDVLPLYLAGFESAGRIALLTEDDFKRIAAAQQTLEGTRIMMAYDGDQPAGFLAFHVDPEVGPKAYGVAVHPDQRLRGAHAGLSLAVQDYLLARGEETILVVGIGGYSPNMVRFLEQLMHAQLERIHVTWRRWFDPQRPVEPKHLHVFRRPG